MAASLFIYPHLPIPKIARSVRNCPLRKPWPSTSHIWKHVHQGAAHISLSAHPRLQPKSSPNLESLSYTSDITISCVSCKRVSTSASLANSLNLLPMTILLQLYLRRKAVVVNLVPLSIGVQAHLFLRPSKAFSPSCPTVIPAFNSALDSFQ